MIRGRSIVGLPRPDAGPQSWAAIRSEDDRRAVARRVAQAREALAEGAAPGTLGLRGVIERSWTRYGDLTQLPSDRAPRAYDEDEAVERFAASPLALAQPVLRSLMAILDPTDDHLAIVTDASGTILWTEGPPRSMGAADVVGAVPGSIWEETVSGTNAMGTAIAERHAVQIFGAEHLRSGVERWVCSAAPVHDPESGELLGAIDLSGEFGSAHPHSLIAVMTAAQTVEHLLAERTATVHSGLRTQWGHLVRRTGAVALVSARGTIIESARPGWFGRRVPIADLEHGTVRVGFEELEVQPVAGGYLLRPLAKTTGRPLAAPADPQCLPEVTLKALAVDRAEVTVDGVTFKLSRRHSEILVLLATRQTGMTDEQIALRLHGEDGRPVTARVELSRMRKLLGPHVITSAPYRLRATVTTDFEEVEGLVRAGRLREALDLYQGVLLPRSESPAIDELRERTHYTLRSALLARPEPLLLFRWIEQSAGEDDVEACRRLARMLDEQDPSRAGVLSRLRRLSQPVVSRHPVTEAEHRPQPGTDEAAAAKVGRTTRARTTQVAADTRRSAPGRAASSA